jgi:hypothetical protein
MYAKPARVTTRVVSLSGDVRALDVFLGPALHRCSETETLGERLNADGLEFIPVAAGERIELLRRDYIADVQLAGIAPEVERLESIGAGRQPVTLHLSTGQSLRGDLVYVWGKDKPRVSDALNGAGNHFLLLLEPDCSHYVNRKAVVRVEA